MKELGKTLPLGGKFKEGVRESSPGNQEIQFILKIIGDCLQVNLLGGLKKAGPVGPFKRKWVRESAGNEL